MGPGAEIARGGRKPVEVPAASLGRLFAFLVDALLLTSFLFVFSVALDAAVGPAVSFGPEEGGAGNGVVVHPGRVILAAIVNVALGAVYFVGSWARGSGEALPATPGQRLLRIAVRQAGLPRPMTLAQATARWLLLMGPASLGALLASLAPGLRVPVALVVLAWYLILLVTSLGSPAGRGLHDRFSGSIVTVRARPAGPPSLP